MMLHDDDPIHGAMQAQSNLREQGRGNHSTARSPRGRAEPAREMSIASRRAVVAAALVASLMCAAVFTVTATSLGLHAAGGLQPALAGSLTYQAAADARVSDSPASKNYGTANYLDADGSSHGTSRSYIRFTVTGLTGPVQSATLRVYSTTDGTSNGPAVYRASNNWTESGKGGIAWNNQPGLLSGAADNRGAISAGSWASYNVTALVNGNGTYSFALIPDSTDRVVFSSREGAQPPELVIALQDTPTPPPTQTPLATSTPGPVLTGPIQHVFVVVMENHSYSDVWNTGSTPYITQLGNTFSRASAYRALTHPSLPNYLQMYAGSKYGITTDCSPSSSCHINARNLADNLSAKGLTWKTYQESMPAPCYLSVSGYYAPKHNPFIYFDDIRLKPTRCANHVVPFSVLSGDLALAATTPNYVFITPNQCNDMHSCSISRGDTWLQNHLPAILQSPACTVEKCLLILTWDEDDNGSGNRVLTIFAGSGAKTGGYVSAVPYTHYSLLRTVEDIFGLPMQTGNDAAASPMSDMLR